MWVFLVMNTYTIQFNSPPTAQSKMLQDLSKNPIKRDLQAALQTVNMNVYKSNIRKSRRSVKKKPRF